MEIKRLYIPLTALALASGCVTGRGVSRADSRMEELTDTYKCVAVGRSSFKDPIAAIKDAEHQARVNYVRNCLGGSEADIGILNREPLTLERLGLGTAAAYNPLEKR